MTTPNASTLAQALQRLLDAQRALDLHEEPGPGYSADAHERAINNYSIATHAAETILGQWYAAPPPPESVSGMTVQEGEHLFVGDAPSGTGFAVFS